MQGKGQSSLEYFHTLGKETAGLKFLLFISKILFLFSSLETFLSFSLVSYKAVKNYFSCTFGKCVIINLFSLKYSSCLRKILEGITTTQNSTAAGANQMKSK